MKNQTVIVEETLEELKERLAREHVEREKKQVEKRALIKQIQDGMMDNLERSIFMNYQLEEINKKLESMVGDKQ